MAPVLFHAARSAERIASRFSAASQWLVFRLRVTAARLDPTAQGWISDTVDAVKRGEIQRDPSPEEILREWSGTRSAH